MSECLSRDVLVARENQSYFTLVVMGRVALWQLQPHRNNLSHWARDKYTSNRVEDVTKPVVDRIIKNRFHVTRLFVWHVDVS